MALVDCRLLTVACRTAHSLQKPFVCIVDPYLPITYLAIDYEIQKPSYNPKTLRKASSPNAPQQVPWSCQLRCTDSSSYEQMTRTDGISQTPATPFSDKFCIFCTLTGDALARFFQFTSPTDTSQPDENISSEKSLSRVAHSTDTFDHHTSAPDGCMASVSTENYSVSKSELQLKLEVIFFCQLLRLKSPFKTTMDTY